MEYYYNNEPSDGSDYFKKELITNLAAPKFKPGFPHVSLYLYHQVRIITEMLLTIIIRIGATTKTELFPLLGQ